MPVLVDGQCIGGVGVSGGDWETDLRIAKAAVESIGRELEVEAFSSEVGTGSRQENASDANRVARGGDCAVRRQS